MTEQQIADFTVDKTGWGDGPWTNEPDRVDFEHAGFACLILRHQSLGHFCGYVGVPETHPAYKKDYDDVNVEVHGGLTYADVCGGHVCHVPKPGMPDNVWWLGFDCAHSCDLSPGMMRYGFHESDTYRTVGYVKNQVESLANQLATMTS